MVDFPQTPTFCTVPPAQVKKKVKLENVTVGGYVIKDVPTSMYTIISRGERGKLMKAKEYMDSLNDRMGKDCHYGTPRSNMIIAALAAAHPNISPVVMEQIIVLARYTFFIECEGPLQYKYSLDQIIEASVSRTTIENHVKDLAMKQCLVASYQMARAAQVNIQTDAGTKHDQQIKVYTWWSPTDITKTPEGSVQFFLADIDVTDKTSADVADGIEHSNLRLCNGNLKIGSHTGDSGGGGNRHPLYREMDGKGMTLIDYLIETCGLHNLQSLIRLPIQKLIGTGGVDKQNAVQALHSVYDLFKMFKKVGLLWKGMVEVEGADTPVPKELWKAIQEPLVTQWWTIGECARFLSKYWKVFQRVAG